MSRILGTSIRPRVRLSIRGEEVFESSTKSSAWHPVMSSVIRVAFAQSPPLQQDISPHPYVIGRGLTSQPKA